MSAGRPVRLRKSGFSNDIAALTRLRTALMLDRTLPREKIAEAVRDLDNLIQCLGDLHQLQNTTA